MENVMKTPRPIPGLSRKDEEEQLARIIAVAQENLERTAGRSRELTEELHDLMETYGPKDKEALALLFNTQSQMRENQRDLIRCRKARKKPYFGRIDFLDGRIRQEESYYVGRVGISQNGREPLVIDWRAPVASVYYENSLGPCRYTVKNEGTFAIDLKRKRTYEIENDKLKDFYDSDVVANDELLNKYLARNKKAVLGEIIATIQKEQNAIIRKSPKTNLIVQGVAGSGKTTVAMHRISYILYNYEEFRPEDFYIIGSNRILLNYITGVLPELDVYGVSQMTMEELFVRLLYEDWDREKYRIRPADRKDPRICRKGSLSWFHDLEEFCNAYERQQIPAKDIRLKKTGALLLSAASIRQYLEEYPRMSMQSKINMLNARLLAKLENELSGKYISCTPEEKKELQKACRQHFGGNAWKGSVFRLYGEFLKEQKRNEKSVPFEEDCFDVYDLAALAFLYKRIKETDGIREASHVIIDEAQDFGMMAYGALAYCLRGCTYTIMGDVSQNIHFGYGLNDWKELQDLILTGTFDSFELLKKSYRNTVEISDFATEILRHGNFSIYPVEPISRHGNPVVIRECADEEDMLRQSAEIIRGWQQEERETIAVICRDQEEAATVSENLGKYLPLADSNLETAEFGSGIMVLPVEYTKGLEFDAVLIYHPSGEHYPCEDGYVKLLYVAATRALHELAVVHRGDLTDLIAKPVPEEKRMGSLEGRAKKPFRFETKRELTDKEQMARDVLQGNKERAMRDYLGPKPLVVSSPKEKKTEKVGMHGRDPSGDLIKKGEKEGKSAEVSEKIQETGKEHPDREMPVNPSRWKFGTAPDSSVLRPRGHGRIDNSVRMVRRTKQHVELISSYGTLRISPAEDDVIRVQFVKGRLTPFAEGFWNYQPPAALVWSARENKSLVEIATEKLTVRVDKKTGAVQFLEKGGRLLLAEKAALPRQVEEAPAGQTWTYFDWGKKEKLWAKGLLAQDLERVDQKARYISFGGKKLRMPLVVSELGYGIGIAAGNTVMCCDIPMYGPYVYTEGSGQIDYYFFFGGSSRETLQLYQKVQ
ncbi:MAG TPA: DUF4968 domain-containing protein [Candidatus Pullilachnospira intestinigallinarum]|nr:DUF4968 domain-containing protein [Candidatus Pullilachnospira intestinigallinarum]